MGGLFLTRAIYDIRMTEPLLIGTHGWEHPAWQGDFYPPELPLDWRFCFYSNRLRSVLVAAESWCLTDDAQAGLWLGDCDPQFRFVLELPATLAALETPDIFDDHWVNFRAHIAPLRAHTVGLLLRLTAAPDRDRLAYALSVLTAYKPVCVDVPTALGCTPDIATLLTDAGAGLCWRADEVATPAPGGRFMVGITSGGNAKTLRRQIEALSAWQHADSSAGLFIQPPGSARMAEEARIIAEILGK